MGTLAMICAASLLAVLFLAPSKAHAAQNVADGVYAFRYNADSSYSLDVPYAVNTPVGMVVNASNSSTAQYWQVKYDKAKDAYKVTPVCALKADMTLTAKSAAKNAKVATQKDKSANTQRWVFKKNPNGSWSMCSKANQSLCVNLANDDRSAGAYIQMYTYSNTDIASQWKMSKIEGASAESVTNLKDADTVFSHSTFMLENARANYPEVLSKPSGWTVSNKNGHPDTIAYDKGVYRGSGSQDFKIMYRDVADVAGRPIDVQVDLSVKPDRNDKKYDRVTDDGNFAANETVVHFNWSTTDKGGHLSSGTKSSGFFNGICVSHTTDYDVTYTVYDHETGNRISLEGAYITVGSLNGWPEGEQGTARYEGVKYNSSQAMVKSYVMADNYLTLYSDGFWNGNTGLDDGAWEDTIGGRNSEKAAVSYLIQDESPRFSFHSTANVTCGAQWEYPLFMPLGVIAPNDPVKEVVING